MTQDFGSKEWLRIQKLLLSIRGLETEKAESILKNLDRKEMVKIMFAFAATQQPETALKTVETAFNALSAEQYLEILKVMPRDELTRLCRARLVSQLSPEKVELLLSELSLDETHSLAFSCFAPAEMVRILQFAFWLPTNRRDEILRKLSASQ